MSTLYAPSSSSRTFPNTLFLTLNQLKQIHCQTLKTSLTPCYTLQTKVISFCSKHQTGDMLYASQLFDTIPEPTVFLWNTMIRGYSRVGWANEAVLMYINMLKRDVKPDSYTFPFLFKGFRHDIAIQYGRELHCHVVKLGLGINVIVQNALVHMYALCGLVDLAHGIFDKSCKEDVVAWNVMFSGYNKLKRFDETRNLFEEMEKDKLLPTSVTLVLILSASSKLKDLKLGERVHNYIKECKVQSTLTLENALIEMYAACGKMNLAIEIFESLDTTKDVISWTSVVKGFADSGQVDLARSYFNRMPARDHVSWTAMINGYLRLNCFKEVLTLFREMQISKIKPDKFTIVSILTACAHLGAVEIGDWINTYIGNNKVMNDLFVGNALIDMYLKCGCVGKANRVFEEMEKRDKFTWTTMIVGLANNGCGEEAIKLFSRMLKDSIKPDEITFIGLLCACTHIGMVDEGRKFFTSMLTQHKIEPNVSHYGCMVDLLGRAGQITEAYEFINNMPIQPNSIVWGALLGACRVHKNTELAELAAKKILEFEHVDSGSVYGSLCNIYAECNKFDKLQETRRLIMKRGIKKIPGCSLIEVNGVVHEFVAGDRSHPQSEEITSKLKGMTNVLKFAGHVLFGDPAGLEAMWQ